MPNEVEEKNLFESEKRSKSQTTCRNYTLHAQCWKKKKHNRMLVGWMVSVASLWSVCRGWTPRCLVTVILSSWFFRSDCLALGVPWPLLHALIKTTLLQSQGACLAIPLLQPACLKSLEFSIASRGCGFVCVSLCLCV